MDYTEFVAYYSRHGQTPNQIQKPKNPLNDAQLKRKFEKYTKSLDKSAEAKVRYTTDDEWAIVRDLVYRRDKNRCQARVWIPLFTHNSVMDALKGDMAKLDPCHVFRKSVHPYLKYDVDNIVILSRLFHSRMDQYRDPFTGTSISYDQVYEYWTKFIGCDRMNTLKEKIKKHKEL